VPDVYHLASPIKTCSSSSPASNISETSKELNDAVPCPSSLQSRFHPRLWLKLGPELEGCNRLGTTCASFTGESSVGIPRPSSPCRVNPRVSANSRQTNFSTTHLIPVKLRRLLLRRGEDTHVELPLLLLWGRILLVFCSTATIRSRFRCIGL
jgi:hypothetical protein